MDLNEISHQSNTIGINASLFGNPKHWIYRVITIYELTKQNQIGFKLHMVFISFIDYCYFHLGFHYYYRISQNELQKVISTQPLCRQEEE